MDDDRQLHGERGSLGRERIGRTNGNGEGWFFHNVGSGFWFVFIISFYSLLGIYPVKVSEKNSGKFFLPLASHKRRARAEARACTSTNNKRALLHVHAKELLRPCQGDS